MDVYWSQLLVPAFATLFVVVDPIGLVPMFLSLTDGMDSKARRSTAVRATLLAGAVLLVFAIAGRAALDFLGISLPAFRIAGGILLFVLALEMLFEKRSERRAKNVEEAGAADTASSHDEIWVFPLGIPLIAGPGAIASVILLMSTHAGSRVEQVLVIAVLAAVLVLTLGLFLLAARLKRFLSATAIRAMTRLLGMILAALAVQFVLTGLKDAGIVG
ncbi:MAG: MarC family protein [Rhizobiales bacterium]|nr:MarC family protein [Hyphomicrobiales bacterium]